MKKILTLLISLLMVTTLSACASKDVVNNNKITELDEKFVYTKFNCLVDGARVRYINFNRGDEVEVIDEDVNFYYIDYCDLTLAIEKKFVRLSSGDKFASYDGYARSNAEVYLDYLLTNEDKKLSLNDIVKVIDNIGDDVLIVEVNGQVRYMKASDVSKSKIVIVTKKQEPVQTNTGSSYNPAPAKDNDGEDVPSHDVTPTSGDGEDITALYLNNNYNLLAASTISTIKADNTPAYIHFAARNEEIHVLDENDNELVVVVEGRIGYMDKRFAKNAAEYSYLEWEGYTRSGAVIYSDYELTDRLDSYSVNEIVKVVDDVDGVYVIELADGTFGYMKSSSVSANKISVYVAPPKVETPVVVPSTPSTPSEPSPEWTPFL